MSFEKVDRLVERCPLDVPDGVVQRGRARFIESVERSKPARFGLRSLAWAAPLAASGLLAAWLLSTHAREPARASVPQAVAASATALRLEAPAQGHKSVELAAGAKAELSSGTVAFSSLTAPGRHRIDLHRGKIKLEIDPERQSSWTVVAGALEVHVIGTVFSVLRDEATRDVEVVVERGKVSVVSSSDRSREHLLRAGQSLLARAEQLQVGEVSTGEDRGLFAPGAESSAAAAARPAPSIRELFEQRYRDRDYRGALAAAESGGFESSLARWDRGSVARLADAARLAGSPKRAEQALQQLRSRFPGTSESADAAFLLGRLYTDSLGAPREAAKWFERYLSERPRGAYAQEALGRLMIAARSTGDNDKAKSVASKYLEQYPQGPYARAASSLVR